MSMIVFIILGAVLGAVCVAAVRLLAPRLQRLVYAVLLWLAAGVYLAFALAGAGLGGVLLELVGLGLFGAAAVVGFHRHLWLLAAGWFLHPLWDIALHGVGGYAPQWYVYGCIGFDLAVGVGILMHYRQLVRRPS